MREIQGVGRRSKNGCHWYSFLRKWVTWHGFAWNIDTDLRYFQRINPCGMSSELVTSLAEHVEKFLQWQKQ